MVDPDLSELTPEQRTGIRRVIADAKLGVAEDLAWHGATFLAIASWLHWDSWLVAAAAAAGYYFIVTRYYGREHNRAWRD